MLLGSWLWPVSSTVTKHELARLSAATCVSRPPSKHTTHTGQRPALRKTFCDSANSHYDGCNQHSPDQSLPFRQPYTDGDATNSHQVAAVNTARNFGQPYTQMVTKRRSLPSASSPHGSPHGRHRTQLHFLLLSVGPGSW